MKRTRRSLLRALSAFGATTAVASVVPAAPVREREFDDSIVSAEIQTTDQTCGRGERVDVSIENGTVTIRGQMEVRTPCYEASFVSLVVDGGTLYVTIGADPEDRPCPDCLGTVEYQARIELNRPIRDVDVTHDPDGFQ